MHNFRKGGFTLVEIMIVVAIIALIAVLALPSFMRARQRARDAKLENALRIAAGAFEMYSAEHNRYPDDEMPGVVPAGMAGYFGTKLNWTAPTPVGGTWDWDNGVLGIKFGVSIDSPTADDAEMQSVDAAIDDGNVATGAFQHINGDRYTVLLE